MAIREECAQSEHDEPAACFLLMGLLVFDLILGGSGEREVLLLFLADSSGEDGPDDDDEVIIVKTLPAPTEYPLPREFGDGVTTRA